MYCNNVEVAQSMVGVGGVGNGGKNDENFIVRKKDQSKVKHMCGTHINE